MPEYTEPTVRGRRRSTRDPLIGTWLDGRFLIEERIATGGFGAIYRARTDDGVPLALKVLHPRLTADPSMVARFQREAATLTQLHDPHTVTTLAVGLGSETGDGPLYIAMELLTGESLHARLEREKRLPWQSAVEIAQAVCSSLAEAHALGVVHRDLKPANIHVESRGGAEVVKVIDFGIVKIAPGSAVDDGMELTYAGHTIGTCEYMSPEQLAGGRCEAASDLYSLGVLLYEMLTGRRPFAEVASPTALMTALLTRTPPPPSAYAVVPPVLDAIVLRCLERAPAQRFASAADLARALDRLAGRGLLTREDTTTLHPTCLRIESAQIRLDNALEIYEVEEVPAIRDTVDDSLARGSTPNAAPYDGFSTLVGMAVITERPSRPRVVALATPVPARRPTPAPSAPWVVTPAPSRPSPPTRPSPRLAIPLPLAAPAPRPRPRLRDRLLAAAVVLGAAFLAGLAAYLLATSL